MTATRLLDTCDVNYRCYPGCDRFRPTRNGGEYQRAVLHSNEQLIPEKLVVAIALVGAESSWMRTYLDALQDMIDGTSRLIDQDRAITRLRLVLSDPSLLPPSAAVTIVQSVRRAFPSVVGLRGHHELVIRSPSTADLPAVLELGEYGFDQLFIRTQANASSFAKAIAFIRRVSRTCFSRIAVEVMLTPGLDLEALFESLIAYRPAHITPCASETVLSSYANALESCAARTGRDYAVVGLNELVHESDPLAAATLEGRVYYSLSGLSLEPEADRLGIGTRMLSKLGDSFFVSKSDLTESGNSTWPCHISHVHHSTADDAMRRTIIHELIAKSRVELDTAARIHGLRLSTALLENVIQPVLRSCPTATLDGSCLSLKTRSVAELLTACALLNRYA